MRVLPILALFLVLSACATATRYDAAGDIHALLVAIRDNDKPAFDAHVDRPALKAQFKARIMAEIVRGVGPMGGVLAQTLGGAAADAVIDTAVQPGVFLAVAEAKGYRPSQPLPGRAGIAASLRALPDDRVCVVDKADGPCLLVFRNEAGAWRLVGYEGPASLLKLP